MGHRFRAGYKSAPINKTISAGSQPLCLGITEGLLKETVPENDPIPGAVIAMQTFGDFLGFNPHAHILVTDGCFYGNKGMFRVAPPLELKKREAIFQHKVAFATCLPVLRNPAESGNSHDFFRQ